MLDPLSYAAGIVGSWGQGELDRPGNWGQGELDHPALPAVYVRMACRCRPEDCPMISLFHCLGILGLCNLPPLLSCLPLPLTAGIQPGRRSSSVLHLPTTGVPKVSSRMTLALSAYVICTHTAVLCFAVAVLCCAVLREPLGEHCNHCLGIETLLRQLDPGWL